MDNDTCPRCGAALHGMAICSACGAAAAAVPSDTPVPASALDVSEPTTTVSLSPPSYSVLSPNPQAPLLRGRVAILLLNVVLLLAAVSLAALNVVAPPHGGNNLVPHLAAPVATATELATGAPIYTVGVVTPSPTRASTGQGAPPPPSAPTTTPRPKPTATHTPPPPTPTPTPTAGLGGG